MTARIRRRSVEAPAALPPAEPEPAATPVETPPVEAVAPARPEEPTPPAVIHPFPEMPAAPAARPEPAYRQHVARDRRQDGRQMSLF